MTENAIHRLLRIASVIKAHQAEFGSDAQWFAECIDRLRLAHHTSLDSAIGLDAAALQEWRRDQLDSAMLRLAQHRGPFFSNEQEAMIVASDLQEFARRRSETAYRLLIGVTYPLLAAIFAIDPNPPQSARQIRRRLDQARTSTVGQ